jgi:hypothetical protein
VAAQFVIIWRDADGIGHRSRGEGAPADMARAIEARGGTVLSVQRVAPKRGPGELERRLAYEKVLEEYEREHEPSEATHAEVVSLTEPGTFYYRPVAQVPQTMGSKFFEFRVVGPEGMESFWRKTSYPNNPRSQWATLDVHNPISSLRRTLNSRESRGGGPFTIVDWREIPEREYTAGKAWKLRMQRGPDAPPPRKRRPKEPVITFPSVGALFSTLVARRPKPPPKAKLSNEEIEKRRAYHRAYYAAKRAKGPVKPRRRQRPRE